MPRDTPPDVRIVGSTGDSYPMDSPVEFALMRDPSHRQSAIAVPERTDSGLRISGARQYRGADTVRWDASQAEAVLAILERRRRGEPDRLDDWDRLIKTEPQMLLREREAQLQSGFSDEEFIRFLLSPDLLRRCDGLRQALAAWSSVDLQSSARQALAYLPAGSQIRASCYPVIKPLSNSFVFGNSDDPMVFLSLDSSVTLAKLKNTIIHELHHIGLYGAVPQTAVDAESGDIGELLQWLWAFGEGFAMLAAAGSPDVHPHAVSTEAERSLWDREMRNLPENLALLDAFFCQVISHASSERDNEEQGNSFFGVQGPWYTVGYHLAASVERRCGRAVLLDCMKDPRLLLSTYQRLADSDSMAPCWSAELINALSAGRSYAIRDGLPPRAT